jgi:hypothetical protein
MPLRLSDKVSVTSAGDQPRRGELFEGRDYLGGSGPHVGFEPAPQSVPECIHLCLRKPLEPPLGAQEMILRGLEGGQRLP